jgi:hypothetical protein
MALKRRVAKDHTCTSVDPTATHAPSSSGPEGKKRGAYALSLTSENFSSSFSQSYSRFLQTCRLRGFTFTFRVRIMVQFLYQDDHVWYKN